jgi:murein DD-endopeptidase MepM/ murein hydrolase activator NlpD
LRLRSLLFSALFAGFAMPSVVPNAIAQSTFERSDLNAEVYNSGEKLFSPSFADMGPIEEGGSFDYPGIGEISYDPGARAEDLFTIGMVKNFGFQNLSLETIDEVTGQDASNASLADFKAIHGLSVQDLVKTIPGLGNRRLSDVPPIQELARQQGVRGGSLQGGGGTIGAIAPFISGPVGQLGGSLVKYGISQIPGLSKIALGRIPGINLQAISSIPGLAYFPLFNPISLKDYFVKYDVGYGMSQCSMGSDCHERNIDNTASGNESNTSIPCMGETQSCAHIEVRRTLGNVTDKIRWISKEQKVPGGNGFICDKEPTGRFPLGKNPKVVLEKIDEKTGKITFALYFKIYGPFGLESAHCFGPFPMPLFSPVKEKGWVLFGPDSIPRNSPFAGLGGSGPAGSGGGGGGGSGSDGDYGGSCIASDGKTSSTYKGVNIASFKNAISNVESRGTGGYRAIGVYVNDGAGNTGRGLGKYQFMSYGPAKDIIGAKPGGSQFLTAMNSPNLNKDDFAAQTEKLFTPAEQESLMDKQIRHLVDVGSAQGYKGDRLLTRMAEMHEGGEASRDGIDKTYSGKVVSDYKSGGCVAGSGNATGNLSYPVGKDTPITTRFGWRTHPVTGQQDFHGAIDFGAQMGAPIRAVDGGVVTFAADAGNCGQMVVIDHKNGIISQYCHMDQFKVRQGDSVSPNQQIGNVGSTGRSTGPHLHFVLKKNGEPIDPLPYLKKGQL